jgi:hypothetical protein
MTFCVSTSAGVLPAMTSERSIRVMRWTFRRDAETVVCELGLNGDDSAYELRIDPPSNPTGCTSETYDDAVSAFQRHGAIERILVGDGWSLESFESTRVPR